MDRLRPTVSLYVPAYNAAGTLDPCLRALARQTAKPDEIIVVDDGSADRSAEIAGRHGVTLIRHRKNRGVAAARNTAVRAARGELVASLDADLVVPRDWLSRMLANFRGRRDIVGCCGRVVEKHTRTIADQWRAVHMKLSFGGRRSYQPRWLYCGISAIRREAMVREGLFDERCRTAYEDVDLSNRLRDRGHTLLYDPTVVATHLKRSRPGDVVRGFWSYWAGKNEMEGAYRSLGAAARLMIRRQMGIVAYRMERDVAQRRYQLLPLDLLIPLTFCVRDLEKMVTLKTLRRPALRGLTGRLAEVCLERCGDKLPSVLPAEWVALAGGGGSNGCTPRLDRAGEAYVRTFAREFDRVLDGLGPRGGEKVVEHVPAVLAEAGVR